MNKPIAGIAAAAFLTCIVLANYVTTAYGMIPVWPEPLLLATAGTYFAGLTFVFRDTVQDGFGKLATLTLIIAGATLSFAVADPFIALASGVAFAASETADLAIYTPLRRRGYLRAAIASNIVGAVVDTILFLWIAGFGLAQPIVTGQLVGKVTVTVALVALVLAARGARKVVPA